MKINGFLSSKHDKLESTSYIFYFQGLQGIHVMFKRNMSGEEK